MPRRTIGRTMLCIILASFLVITIGAEVDVPPQPRPTSSSPSPDTTTPSTPKTTTITTTTAPTTTTATPTTSASNTTTITPPTLPPITTSTTTAPNTTTPTTAIPSTTPIPPPAPKPADVGKWTVTDDTTNVTCIIAQMAVQLNVSYVQKDSKFAYAVINVPINGTTASGSCGNLTQMLNLTWAPAGAVNQSHVISLRFNKNVTSKLVKVDRIDVVLQANVTEFPDIQTPTIFTLKNTMSEFSTNVGMSYSCTKLQTLNLTKDDGNSTLAVIGVTQLRVEAFHEKQDTSFNSAKDCETSSSTDIVPIVVGCALVGLVAIVLIAYLVGRRRSQARGYLSM